MDVFPLKCTAASIINMRIYVRILPIIVLSLARPKQ